MSFLSFEQISVKLPNENLHLVFGQAVRHREVQKEHFLASHQVNLVAITDSTGQADALQSQAEKARRAGQKPLPFSFIRKENLEIDHFRRPFGTCSLVFVRHDKYKVNTPGAFFC